MKSRPIVFSAPMVRAILAGTKTQTRRVIKDADTCNKVTARPFYYKGCLKGAFVMSPDCPYGQPGDQLWVRETWQQDDSDPSFTYYRADGKECAKWRSPIYMPRNRSRITLELTSVKVERLQDISEEDAKAEGAEKLPDYLLDPNPYRTCRYREGFCYIWQSIHGPESWEQNPWVWRIEFRRV